VKQKRQIAVLIVLLVIAAVGWLWNSRGENRPNSTDHHGLIAQNAPIVGVQDPQIRLEEIGRARQAEYKSSGRSIFSEVAQPAATAGPHPAPKPTGPVPNACGIVGQGPCPPAPPPPPPVCKLPTNVKFFGYGVVPNGTSRRAFFTDPEGAVQVVSEGEVLMNRFRVLKIGNANLEFEDVSSKCTVGSAPLEEQAGNPPGGPSGGG